MKYEIIGSNMQYLRITLAEGERIYSDSGKLISKTDSIKMTPRMVGGVIGTLERKAVGVSGLLTEFACTKNNGIVSISDVFPGKVFQVKLGDGEEFITEKDSFLAADDSVKLTIHAMNLGMMMFGGEGIIFQKFVGPGNLFIHVVGDIIEHDIDGANSVQVEPRHIAGFSPSLQYNIKLVDNIKTAMFGGVGIFLVNFSGTGRLVTHSVSRYKLITEIMSLGMKQQKSKQ